MKKKPKKPNFCLILCLFSATLLLASCGIRPKQNDFDLHEQLVQLENILRQAKDVNAHRTEAKAYINYARQLAKQERKDTLSPVYLFRAGDVARGLGEANLAIELWQQVYQRYKNFDKRPDALFLQGFTYENELQNFEKAKPIYEQFLKKYPDHFLAESVNMSLLKLGHSPDELIEIYQKN